MMVTRIRRTARRQLHLYIEEWMAERGLNDETLGGRLGVGRVTMWRRRNEQHRLNPEKIAQIAHALDIAPEDLYRPPSRPSLDAMVKDAPEDVQTMAADIVRRLVAGGR